MFTNKTTLGRALHTTLLVNALTLYSISAVPVQAAEPETVVIIGGAGAAGIAAGYEFAKRGVDFMIFEASGSVGGRIQKFNFDGLTLEQGANWIVGISGNPAWDLAKKYGLNVIPQNWEDLTVYDQYGELVQSPYHPIQDPAGTASYEAWLGANTISEDCLQTEEVDLTLSRQSYCDSVRMSLPVKDEFDYSIADLQKAANGFEATTPVKRVFEYFNADYEFADPPALTSGKGGFPLHSYRDFKDADHFVLDPRGFQWIIESLAAEYIDTTTKTDDEIVFDPDDRQLQLNTKILKVEYNIDADGDGDSDDVRVHTCMTNDDNICRDKNREVHVAKYFMPTFSIGVLQQVLADDAKRNKHRADSSPEFVPALDTHPGLAEAIDNYTLALYSKVFFRFPFKFWDETQLTLSAVGAPTSDKGDARNGEYAPIWQSLDIATGNKWAANSRVLFVTVTGERSRELQNITDEEIKEQMLAVLHELYGDKIAQHCAEHGSCSGAGGIKLSTNDIEDFYTPRMLHNPLFYGMYTNWRTGRTLEHQATFIQPRGNLVISGDATCTRYWGYVHGGLLAGKKSASYILDQIGYDDVELASACDLDAPPGFNPYDESQRIIKANGKGR